MNRRETFNAPLALAALATAPSIAGASTVTELAAKVLVADDGGDIATGSTNAGRLVMELRALVGGVA